MNNCIFCKIIAGEIPSDKVYEDEAVFAFRDIDPQAPVHILVIPKTHIPSCADITTENVDTASKCLLAIAKIAKQEGLEDGFRVISNCGGDSGQTVFHLHFHILAGRKLSPTMV